MAAPHPTSRALVARVPGRTVGGARPPAHPWGHGFRLRKRSLWSGKVDLYGPRRDLRSRLEVELLEDVLDVRLDGALGQDEPVRDLAVRRPSGDQAGDLRLAW